ncbi:MAG: type II secretion system secretin GspD [Gammaproteobacteria bacterium]|nr:MAG: type II secretion system secretin GspD [Gammaproteobacteria bacterium]
MKSFRAVSARHAIRRTGGLLCVVAGTLLSGCESLHPDIVKGYTVGEVEGAAAEAEAGREAVTRPTAEIVPGREPRPAAFYEPGTGVFVGTPAREAKITGEGNITLNFENTNLREVVKVILGDLLNENYTIDPAVQGAATLQTSDPLSRDDLIPTLELLLRMNGAALISQNGLYNVVPRESALRGMLAPQLGNSGIALPQGYSIRIVPLSFIAAEEMRKILEPFTTAGNIARVDTVRNLLILAGGGPELARLLETVRIFDVDWLEGMSVALFTPDFVDAETLSSELKVVFGESGDSPLAGLIKFTTLERLNALLVITPRPQYLKKVGEWVERLDRDSGGVGQRLFVYRVQNGKAADLATVLSEVFGRETGGAVVRPPELAPGLEAVEIAPPPAPREGEQGAPVVDAETAAAAPAYTPAAPAGGDGVVITEGTRIRVIADEINNALVILATSQQYKQVEATLRRLDVPPLQVLIEATIAEITLKGDLKYGMEWFFSNQLGSKQGIGTLDLGASGIAAVVPGFSYQIIDKAGAVRAVLNALAEDSRLNVISSPSLMVLNNQTASIDVGDEVPIVTQQQQSVVGTSSPIVNNIEYRNTGVLLSVTPRVNAGGMVIMDVEQEVSQVASETTDTTNLTPTISKRSISTSVAVQSGQTVVLGGLIREQKVQSRSGIPGLYNMPIIGPLFGATLEEQVRTELVVLITPRVVRNSAEAAQVTEEFRSKMESLRPLTIPGGNKGDEQDEVKTKRAWPRVGPDEGVSEVEPADAAKPVEPSVEVPVVTTDSPPGALVLDGL